MKQMATIVIGTLLFFLVSGCHPTEGDKIDQEKVSIINYRVLKNNKIPKQIKNWLENNKENEQAMFVNDDGKYYIVITRGQKNTGGYGVDIEEITLSLVNGKDNLKVKVKYIDPAPGMMVTLALTYPYLVAEVDLKAEPSEVKFDIKNK